MSAEARMLSGEILILVPTVIYGGYFLLTSLMKRAAGYTDNPLRRSFFVAGHAHAGVIILLSLIIQPLVDQTSLEGVLLWLARHGAPIAAILMPAGFFLSVASPTADRPGLMRYAIYAGALLLVVSMLILGVGLVTTN